jgi:bifunctional non-homologous end joining protein LigD
VRPQLTQLVDTAPDGDQWLHEIKYDGYRMHARLERAAVKLLTRTGLDWTHKYPAIAEAVAALDAREAYLDGELCGVGPDGITSFNIVQLASDRGNAASLVFFLFDLLYLDGEDLGPRPLIERKDRLGSLLANAAPCLHYSDHVIGQGPVFYDKACAMHVEGIVSKRIDSLYTPGNRGCDRPAAPRCAPLSRARSRPSSPLPAPPGAAPVAPPAGNPRRAPAAL